MRREVSLPASEAMALGEGQFVRLTLDVPAWMPNGALVTSLLVGRARGALRAYANVCLHHPLPLDYDAATFESADRAHLCCHQHGALYRKDDGFCVDGPCRGERLFCAGVEEREGRVVFFVDG
jgi:nitrite reductase/ring-hydroxylating ferredoxin subunit